MNFGKSEKGELDKDDMKNAMLSLGSLVGGHNVIPPIFNFACAEIGIKYAGSVTAMGRVIVQLTLTNRLDNPRLT